MVLSSPDDTGEMRIQHERKTEGMDVRVRRFCVPCNTGWMSSLEGAVQPILTPMILGQRLPLALSISDQETLAQWAYKTALTLDPHIIGITERGRRERLTSIPRSAYRRYFNRRTLSERWTRVWTIPLSSGLQGAWGQRNEHAFLIKRRRLRHKLMPTSHTSVYMTTLVVGHACFQVLGHLKGMLPPILSDTPDALLQLFPRVANQASWPSLPSAALEPDALNAFAAREDFYSV